jgi:cytoskeletal protein CcmA (bactofilin family)
MAKSVIKEDTHMHSFTSKQRRWFGGVALATILVLALAGVALAAQFEEGEVYRLPAGQVVTDDLYVTAGEIYIDGVVEGDLVAAGGIIEINGEVTEDVLAAGASIAVNGRVGDDVRAAGAGITVAGSVGDDVLLAGGGSGGQGMPVWPIQIGGRTVEQGVRILDSADIGGDAIVAGGRGEIAGAIGGDLLVGMGAVTIAADVAGDATVYSGSMVVTDSANIGGSFSYQSENPGAVPSSVAESIQIIPPAQSSGAAAQPPPSLAEQLLWWTISVVRALLGLLVFGWLLVKLAPQWSNDVANDDERRRCGRWPAWRVIVIAAFVPLTLLAIGIVWLFWDFFPGVAATSLFLFGFWGVLWFASPLFSGYCLGKTLFKGQRSALLQLFLGALIIVLAARAAEWIPFVGGFLGWLIMVGSFGFTAGAILLARRQADGGAGGSGCRGVRFYRVLG